MFKGIRTLTQRDRLAQRVVDLEEEVRALRDNARLNLGQTNFREVMKPFRLESHVRDHVVARVVNDLAPLLEPHILRTLKDCQRAIRRDGDRAAYTGHVAIADMRDYQVEVHLPALTTSFRVSSERI